MENVAYGFGCLLSVIKDSLSGACHLCLPSHPAPSLSVGSDPFCSLGLSGSQCGTPRRRVLMAEHCRKSSVLCGPGVAGSRASPRTRWFLLLTARSARRKRTRASSTLTLKSRAPESFRVPLPSQAQGPALQPLEPAGLPRSRKPSVLPTRASASLSVHGHCALRTRL